MEKITENFYKIKIKETEIFLEEKENQGKLIISNVYGHNYSNSWGSMNGNLTKFISSINSDYFADKMLGCEKSRIFDIDKTFTNLRKFIREELDLPWYKYQAFQKDMRDVLNDFKTECENFETEEFFVYNFHSSFLSRLNFYLIEKSYERERLEKDFKSAMSEQWFFIERKLGPKYIWLKNLHKELVKVLKQPPITNQVLN